MAQQLVRNETPAEYFRELVKAALLRQRLQAGELTAFYVVNLLTTFIHLDREVRARLEDEPLALQLNRALKTGGSSRRHALRVLGDVSLFVAGFFPDSLNRRLVDVDYYATLGGYAYGSLSRFERDTFAPVFAELASSFLNFVDVLSEVSERCAMSTNTDLLRIYEKWLRTGSRRDGQLLVERGIVPQASPGSRFLH
jgi:hypothetical protein